MENTLHPLFKDICAQFGMTEKKEAVMENYKGYNIMEVFKYTTRSIYTGEQVYLYSDWHAENPDTETSFNEHKKSIAQVRERIDEIINLH